MITLTGRTLTKTVEAVIDQSLLAIAQKASIDWQFNCSRGTCAKCRCKIIEGSELLSEVNDAEWDRLGPDELEAGFRLGCQAIVVADGNIKAMNKTYF
ncbi:2Fe-2S iron-sulfur cluster-binding protein [Cohnella cholangitidis]|uniref:(2Fe-2S)-binding protein n=1 Tax=Cohnella cholangitidis TaxID=2598458 RepID=A0A7G5C579_9BACL|nr:2Fe-2S iron-sulfur cluster-binding protein [Cohnella cholangitidis]QMV44363.1 (2Fe-2S)-binding protein [Cohnella cholangitidis]